MSSDVFTSTVLPGACILCLENSADKLDLCADCIADFPANGQKCCGLLNNCNVFVPYKYAHPIDRLLLSIKFCNNMIAARSLGIVFAEFLMKQYRDMNTVLPEIIIPVPLHRGRLKERGYNQAIEIIRSASKILEIPFDKSSFERIKNTAPQSLLGKNARKRNVKGAFRKTKGGFCDFNHVAIFDDIMTTSSTMKEFSKVILRSREIEKVDIWCVARA